MKMRNKNAALSIETIVIIILAVLVLLVVIFIFSSTMRQLFTGIFDKVKSVLGLWEASGIE